MALWNLKVPLLALAGMMLVAVISVFHSLVVDRGKQPDEGHDRAAEREQKWYPLG
jgi:hypothetical protein